MILPTIGVVPSERQVVSNQQFSLVQGLRAYRKRSCDVVSCTNNLLHNKSRLDKRWPSRKSTNCVRGRPDGAQPKSPIEKACRRSNELTAGRTSGAERTLALLRHKPHTLNDVRVAVTAKDLPSGKAVAEPLNRLIALPLNGYLDDVALRALCLKQLELALAEHSLHVAGQRNAVYGEVAVLLLWRVLHQAGQRLLIGQQRHQPHEVGDHGRGGFGRRVGDL